MLGTRAGPQTSILCASNVRFGSGKSTIADHLVNLSDDLRRQLSEWARGKGSHYEEACKNLFSAWYLQLHVGDLRTADRGVSDLSQSLALLLWEKLFGTQDGFDVVSVRALSSSAHAHRVLVLVQKVHSWSALLTAVDAAGTPILLHWEEVGELEAKPAALFGFSEADSDRVDLLQPASAGATAAAVAAPVVTLGAIKKQQRLWVLLDESNNNRFPRIWHFVTGRSLALSLLHRGFVSDVLASPSDFSNTIPGALQPEHIEEILLATLADGKPVAEWLGVHKSAEIRSTLCQRVFRLTAGVPRLLIYALAELYRIARSKERSVSDPDAWDALFGDAGPVQDFMRTAPGMDLQRSPSHSDLFAKLHWGSLLGTEFSSSDEVQIGDRKIPLIALVQHWLCFVARATQQQPLPASAAGDAKRVVESKTERKSDAATGVLTAAPASSSSGAKGSASVFRFRMVMPESHRLLAAKRMDGLEPLFFPVPYADQGAVLEHFSRLVCAKKVIACTAKDGLLFEALGFLAGTAAANVPAKLELKSPVAAIPGVLGESVKAAATTASKSAGTI